jgi:hypothetical protein
LDKNVAIAGNAGDKSLLPSAELLSFRDIDAENQLIDDEILRREENPDWKSTTVTSSSVRMRFFNFLNSHRICVLMMYCYRN